MSGAHASAFLILDNQASAPVVLVAASSPEAASVQLHDVAGGRMQPVGRVEVPARGRLALVPGHYHLMLQGLVHPLAVGDSVTLTLRFMSGPPLSVRAPVLRYGDAMDALGR